MHARTHTHTDTNTSHACTHIGWPGIISKMYMQTVQLFQAYHEEIFYSIQNVLTATWTSPNRVEVCTTLQSIFNLHISETTTAGWRVADANK